MRLLSAATFLCCAISMKRSDQLFIQLLTAHHFHLQHGNTVSFQEHPSMVGALNLHDLDYLASLLQK
jgi:hypothetical protein